MVFRAWVPAALVAALAAVAGAAYLAVHGRTALREANALRAEMRLLTEAREAQNAETAAVRERYDRTSTALQKAEGELEAAKRANLDLGNKLAGYSEELVRKQSELRQVSETQARLVEQLQRDLDNQSITITRLGNLVSVNMVGHVLFASGQASLTPAGIEVLRRVGQVIGQTADKRIRVVGHTDDVPISAGRQSLYPSNWELSACRATSVVRFLVEHVGLPPARLEAVGLAEFHPVAGNDTAAGRSRNRRIEILLTPELRPSEPAPQPAAVGSPAP